MLSYGRAKVEPGGLPMKWLTSLFQRRKTISDEYMMRLAEAGFVVFRTDNGIVVMTQDRYPDHCYRVIARVMPD